LSCDSYYGIGDKHQVCQDYALHGTIDEMEYVIVSDGCSSAEYSEIGAQILCHAAKYQIALCNQTGLFKECSLNTLSSVLGNGILKRIDEVRMSYPISRGALEATLLIAVNTPDRTFVFGWGDGVIIERYRASNGDEFQAVVNIDFSANAPFYLVCDRENYLKGLQERGYDEPLIYYTYHYKNTPAGGTPGRSSSVEKEKLSDGMPYTWLNDKKIYEVGGLISITVCSDGIKSFQDECKNSVELMTVVPEIVGYKSTEGDFVKKRMFFLKRKAEKNNWLHYDDIGCGTILIDKNI